MVLLLDSMVPMLKWSDFQVSCDKAAQDHAGILMVFTKEPGIMRLYCVSFTRNLSYINNVHRTATRKMLCIVI